MTFVYGATIGGTVDWLRDQSGLTKEITDELGLDFNKTLGYAARKLFTGIDQTVPAASDAMRWLRGLAQQQPSGKAMEWEIPTGFVVRHDYQSYEDRRVNVKSSNMSKLMVRDWTDGTDPNRMKNAISPNFVHAMDAAHLQLTAVALKAQGICMVGIHDSFGTHPKDVDDMQRTIRQEFCNLYQDREMLSNFLWTLGAIGESPRVGTLKLEQVLDSEYFFS